MKKNKKKDINEIKSRIAMWAVTIIGLICIMLSMLLFKSMINDVKELMNNTTSHSTYSPNY